MKEIQLVKVQKGGYVNDEIFIQKRGDSSVGRSICI